MSIEAALAEQTAAIKENTAAVTENTARVMELLAASEKARELIGNMDGAAPAKPRATRKKADAPAEQQQGGGDAVEESTVTSTTAAATSTSTAASPIEARREVDTSDDGLRKLVGDWLQGTNDAAVRGERAGQVQAMLQHFGSPTIAGEKSTLDESQRYQVTFYVARMIAGLPVDYSQDYDFDGDPLFDQQPEAAADDLLG